MCGILGSYRFASPTSAQADVDYQSVLAGLNALRLRGPDNQAAQRTGRATLGHARLSIIDTSAAAHQPMQDPSGRYTLVFNGEIFNFLDLKPQVEQWGITLRTTSDTEVLLHLLIREGEAALQRLNGFFALALHDAEHDTLFIARDRMGIKPMWLWQHAAGLAFASELKALLAMGAPTQVDPAVLATYLETNYVPPRASMLQGLQKLLPGHYAWVRPTGVETKAFWAIPGPSAQFNPAPSYETAQRELTNLLDASVQRRLISDVPLGVFLSGGIDSSVVAALAARHAPQLQTFSLGFVNPLYDETRYAEAVARKIGSEHTVFRISEDDLYGVLHNVLGYLDEPFADASALNFYILSQHVRKRVTVALSGDGADELFGGYSKHIGEAKARGGGLLNTLIKLGNPLLQALPSSRNSKLGRKLWQGQKYARGLKMEKAARYRKWCGVLDPVDVRNLMAAPPSVRDVDGIWAPYLSEVRPGGDMNDVLRADLQLVLAGDMLTKADLMSMANSLEVRVPFLDYTVVEYAAKLPAEYKVTPQHRKRILQDLARPLLPPELYNRPKQGFEVPLADWFRGSMRSYIEKELLDEEFLRHQGLFQPQAIRSLWDAVRTGTNGKEDWTLWALIVFQSCYKKWGTGK